MRLSHDSYTSAALASTRPHACPHANAPSESGGPTSRARAEVRGAGGGVHPLSLLDHSHVLATHGSGERCGPTATAAAVDVSVFI